ncbi:MAG: UDP-N-acetylmuramoyl-tripeptide--D-alanyl-D-alanine ligase [Phycisphaerae bacterium]|nr:UDP-N-acetylmuramoyl-tripeptide--D-alanyl-D-alanine ligase [Phycisphaerae bacterium]
MKKFSIKDLSCIIKAHESQATSHERRFFTGISTDSRTVKSSDCFFAIAGDNFDGHDYLPDVFAKGAACAVVSRDIDSDSNCLLRVNDTTKAIGDFAAEYRRLMNFKVVAITGSVGKTTARQILYHVLSQHYRVYQSPKNFNNQIGLPVTLLGAAPDCQIVIAELGTNHPSEIAHLTRIAQPNIAVVTNVHPAHLQGFGDVSAIAKEKLSISQGLSPDGVLIINAEILTNYQSPITNHHIITFGKSSSSDLHAENISFDGIGSKFSINAAEIHLPLLGPGNIENALAAWAVCSQLGVTIRDFAQAVTTLSAVSMRAELLQIGKLTVLNDCYNANPASMKNALDILANLAGNRKNRAACPGEAQRRRVFICGDMAELGQQTQSLHTELGAAVAQAKVQLLLTVGDFAKIVAQAAKNTAKYDLQTKSFADTLSACNSLTKFIKDYDIVLVKGSRINKLELAVEKLKELFT